MLWSLDMDDFRGAFCGKGRYPLLTAIVTAIGDKLPDVTVRMTDTVTWPHPDDVTSPLPPSPSTTSEQPVRTSSTTRVSTSTRTSVATASTTTFPLTPTVSSSKTRSSSTAVPRDRSTQQVVVITKKSSHAALHLSCRLLLTVAFLVLHVLPL